jgi:sulfoxide reductase heme-binding subunit YedZ
VLGVLLSALSLAGLAQVTSLSAYLGSFLLAGALIPTNLLRFRRYAGGPRLRALARLRRPLGVSAGLWFVVHSVVSVRELFDLSARLLPQFTRTGIVLGLLAAAVFVAMLLTSTDRAQRAMGVNWKRLHRLVWLAVPLTLAHVLLASGVDSPSNLIYVGLIAFAGFEYRALRGRGAQKAHTHIALIVFGAVVSFFVYVVL